MTDRPVVVGLWYRLVGGCALALLLGIGLEWLRRRLENRHPTT